MQRKFSCFLTVMIMLLCVFSSTAQQKKELPKGKPAKDQKGMVPVYQSSLGNVLSNTLPVSMMKKLLDSSLIARGKGGKKYQVVAFDFGYQKEETVVNDTTGRPELSRVYQHWYFQGNRLDSIWRVRVKSELKSGDRLYFDRVIATDKGGIHYLSSSLHFKIN